jgi:hypothetical protein
MISFNKSFLISNTDVAQNNNYTTKLPFSKIDNFNTTNYKKTPLADRVCKIDDFNHSITTLKAHNVFQSISTAIKESQIGNAYYSTCNSILPVIHLINKPCFFKINSTNIQKLFVDSLLTLAEKFEVLDKTYQLLEQSNFSEAQLFYAKHFILSAYNCLQICRDINLNAISHETFQIASFDNIYNFLSKKPLTIEKKQIYSFISQQLLEYPISLDLMFIEEESRFTTTRKHPDKIVDLGAHAFDNEWLYMERCYRAFIYLLNKQIKEISNINFTDLREVNAILGGYTSSINKNSVYCCDIPRNYGHQFINLVRQGIICDTNFQYSAINLDSYQRIFELEFFIYRSLGVVIKLEEIVFQGNKYFKIKSSTGQDNSLTAKKKEQLLKDLHGQTNNKAFIFNIGQIDDYNFYLQIQYCYYKQRDDTCQQLLGIYYKEIKNFSTIEQKVSLAVSLCSLLQRIHPFLDANGRTLFFILFPVLLYQMGIWPIKMLRNPWVLLELTPAKNLAHQILDVCIPAPKFQSTITAWNKYITVTEKMRINCALGNIAIIKDLLEEDPNIILNPIINDPLHITFNILEFSIIHKQQQMFIFLFNRYPKSQLTFSMLLYLLDRSIEYHQIEIFEYLLNYMKKTHDFSLPAIINNKIFL